MFFNSNFLILRPLWRTSKEAFSTQKRTSSTSNMEFHHESFLPSCIRIWIQLTKNPVSIRKFKIQNNLNYSYVQRCHVRLKPSKCMNILSCKPILYKRTRRPTADYMVNSVCLLTVHSRVCESSLESLAGGRKRVPGESSEEGCGHDCRPTIPATVKDWRSWA